MLNEQKYIDKEKCTALTNDELINDNAVFNKFSFSVGPLLQVVNICRLRITLSTKYQFMVLYLQVIDSIFENEIKSGISVSLPVTNVSKNDVSCILNASIIGANYAIKKYDLKR